MLFIYFEDKLTHRYYTRANSSRLMDHLEQENRELKEEVKKHIDVGFLVTSKYSQWVANIVLVLKKDEKVHICVDYKDLNKASPKDDFPLPHIDMLVDNTAKFKVFFIYWMDFLSENCHPRRSGI